MLLFYVKNLKNKIQKDQTKLSSLIANQKKVKNTYKNTKKYPAAHKVKFTMSGTTSTIIKLTKKQGCTTHNKEKNQSINQNQL